MTLFAAQSSTRTEAEILSALAVVEAALATVPADVAAYGSLSDSDLVTVSTAIGRQRDALGALGAAAAGEIARRSAPEFGSRGLAQRHGFRTPIEMVKVATRSTGREATTAVRTGMLLVEVASDRRVNPATGKVSVPEEPWMAPVAQAVTLGLLPLPAVDAIRLGLGTPNSVVTVEHLAAAAARLVAAGAKLDPDQLLKSARSERQQLDAGGIGAREDERRALRSWRMFANSDGGGRAVVNFDPEGWTVAKALYDGLTSPKLNAVRSNAVRFRDGDSAAADYAETADTAANAANAANDSRTIEQLAFDGMLHLLAVGADADPSELLGTGAPVVKLIVTVESLEAARAAKEQIERARETATVPTQETLGALETLAAVDARHGFIEGQLDAVSISTIQRSLEVGTAELVVFDDRGVALEHGALRAQGSDDDYSDARAHRLFSRQQKSILAVRDGGCRWPGCDRPPSWCEAHHIRWWMRHNGSTRVDNGILLCKHHHLLLHNNGWEIERPSAGSASTRAIEFVLVPPANVDPARVPRPMPSKSSAWNAIYGSAGAVS